MLWIILLTFLVIYLRGVLWRREPSLNGGYRDSATEGCAHSMKRCGCRVEDKTLTDTSAT